MRSYLFEVDAAAAYLILLASNVSGQALNVAPKTSLSIRELAIEVANAASVTLDARIVETNDVEKGFGGITRSILDCSRLTSLGWRPEFDIKEGLAITLSALRERMSN